MIIAFSGWRRWTDTEFTHKIVLRALNWRRPFHLRVGDCPTGVDQLVRESLDQLRVPYELYEANWDQYGTMAGPIRNKNMLEGVGADQWGSGVAPSLANVLVALPEPGSRPAPGSGTWGCVGLAYELGVKVILPSYNRGEGM